MNRKILGICMALAAFGAIAIGPTSASAFNLHLTDTSEGVTKALPIGAKPLAIGETSEASTFVAGESTISCNENTLAGLVTNNTTVGGNVKGEITFASFDSHLNASGTDCRSEGGFPGTGPVAITVSGLPWCIQAGAADTWSLFGKKCGTEGNGLLTFTFNFTNLGLICKYKREAALNGTFSTAGATHEAATLSVTGQPEFVREEGAICPAAQAITNMKFRLYTNKVAANTTNYDDATSTANPVWLAE